MPRRRLVPLAVSAAMAWFGAATAGVQDAPASPSVAISGTVRDAKGQPVDGALVALVPPLANEAAAFTASAGGGRFTLRAPAGRYGLTATSPGGIGYLDVRAYDAPRAEGADIALQAGVPLTGRVTVPAAHPLPPDARLKVTRVSDYEADLFYVPVDRGGFATALPAGSDYTVALGGGEFLSDSEVLKLSQAGAAQPSHLVIEASPLGPPPAEVVDWIGRNAIPLATAEAGHGFADLGPLKGLVGDARVVALGEATHGTREFFQLKHRLLEYLVSELGFTVFAIEANWPEALAVDEYVRTGKGDARDALAGMYFWTWNTEEVLALIEWMRRWNADPGHARKVRFLGFDMQFAASSLKAVTAYLEKVDPEYARTAAAGLAPFAQPALSNEHPQRKEAERVALREAVKRLRARFAENRIAWSRAAGETEWRLAEHHAQLLEQAEALFAGGGGDARDRAMAENVQWILDTEPAGTRVVVWAHNGHVSASVRGWTNQGMCLRKALGPRYLPVGFVYAQGGFQAMSTGASGSRRLQEFVLGPPAETDMSVPFTRAGRPLAVLDLRPAPAGVVADWFQALHPMRENGAVFDPAWQGGTPYRLSGRFDAVVFVEKTTRARPLVADVVR